MSLAEKQTTPDLARAEAFAEDVGNILNAGAVASMMAIGHRLGLFDVLAALPPASSETIARRAQLAERYVREWLAVMVTGRIVDYQPRTKTYHLPDAHAACLTRGAALGNFAIYAQHVAIIGQMQDRLVEVFRSGAGIPYSDYPGFHQIMEEDSGQTVTAQLFDTILPLADGLMERLADGIDVLDAGCGRGSALLAMAERFPKSRFVGYDLGADAIDYAAEQAATRGLANVRFEARDLTGYHEQAGFDLITSFDAIHDQKEPQELLRGLHGALRQGGLYLVQDIGGSARLENNLDFPMASLLYAVSTVHCTPVSLAQGGQGLGTMWGWETAERMLHEAGFSSVERHVLPHDPMNVWFVAQA